MNVGDRVTIVKDTPQAAGFSLLGRTGTIRYYGCIGGGETNCWDVRLDEPLPDRPLGRGRTHIWCSTHELEVGARAAGISRQGHS